MARFRFSLGGAGNVPRATRLPTNLGNPFAVANQLEQSASAGDAAFNAQLDALSAPVTTEAATAEAQPILSAIDARAGYERPAVRANTFAGDAEAGFGLSGRAVQNVDRALGTYDAGTAAARSGAIRQAMADITGRNQAAATGIMARAQLQEQKNANKRRKFLGIF